MNNTTFPYDKLRICIDYYNHLLIASLKPKVNSISIKDSIIKGYRYFTILLFLNFFNSLDNIKYKYFHGIKTFINKGKIYLFRGGFIY